MEDEPVAADQQNEIEQLKAAFPGKVKVISNIGEFTNVVSVQPADLDFHIKFQLTAAYPEISPVISIRSVLSPDQKEALTSHLESRLSEEHCPSLTELCTSCGSWLQDNEVEAQEPATKQAATKHEGKKKGKKNKNKTKVEETPQVGKKPPMKTAHDVIKRLTWDAAVDKENFIVGYMDRIVGLVERPFVEFTWEDLASVDHFALAIPQHRIQYFKYKTEKVWDKNDRLDNVFGSTGSGTTIVEAVEKYEAKLRQAEEAADADNNGADAEDAICERSESRDEETEEKENDNNERPNSKSVEHDRTRIVKDTCQTENDNVNTEDDKKRDNIETTKDETEEVKRENDEVKKNDASEDMKQDKAESIGQSGMNLDPEPASSLVSLDSAPATGSLDPAPVTDTESPEDPRFVRMKGRRNYFVALRITNQGILDKVATVQTELETRYPQYKPHRNPGHTMHVTLNAMTLSSVHDLQRCKLAMEKIIPYLAKLSFQARPVAFKGVGCFSSKVVFARVDCPPELYDIANLIVKTFKEEGISVESKGLGRNPHLTLFKVGRSDEWKDFDLNLRHYKGVNFGRQIIDNIHVCQMAKLPEEQGGFYATIFTLTCGTKQSSRN